MSKTLFILNDAPYGIARPFKALSLATGLSKREGEEVRVFLLGSGTTCAKSGQKPPPGAYNIEAMVKGIVSSGGRFGVCDGCMDAAGIAVDQLVEGCERSTHDDLVTWILWADRVLVF